MNGTVKWFDTKKGFGFVTTPEGKDVFVHYTGIQGRGLRNLTQNDEVTFDVSDSGKGPKAVNVRIVNRAGA